MTNGLTLKDIRISQGDNTLISLDTHVDPGKILTIMGPSGSGKSTLLSKIIGTLPSNFTSHGRVLLDNRDITDLPTHQRHIGLLFQDDLLFPHLSVGDNLAFGLRPGGSKAERSGKIESALNEIGLDGYQDRDPTTLSGGQKARVSLMRMLLSDACALLLDEPFSRLDANRREQIRQFVFDLARARSLPVVLVTHDEQDAFAANGPIIKLAETIILNL